uniref:Orf c04017 protein n=1 Tax=Saccharolobus solfataricus TaxID=2287 RepID=P95956_SACSO|nr:orf c04017 [Saccharolobus solfataricus P2]
MENDTNSLNNLSLIFLSINSRTPSTSLGGIKTVLVDETTGHVFISLGITILVFDLEMSSIKALIQDLKVVIIILSHSCEKCRISSTPTIFGLIPSSLYTATLLTISFK